MSKRGNVYDLSAYRLWEEDRTKIHLRSVTTEINRLAADLRVLGEGSKVRRNAELLMKVNPDNEDPVGDCSLCLRGEKKHEHNAPLLRNPYKHEQDRRIDLVTAKAEIMQQQVPHLGEKRAQAIVAYREKYGLNLDDFQSSLRAALGIKKMDSKIVNDIWPFTTLAKGFHLPHNVLGKPE